ncbi:LRR-RLK [Artemisia annua]|uniref:LRR-RLK n=1 Tax=Artemisia annua TaxID=35608 RepID=A0A2U1N5D5_ARTAN|nr:LRR-RLK [Artemisia annua]
MTKKWGIGSEKINPEIQKRVCLVHAGTSVHTWALSLRVSLHILRRAKANEDLIPLHWSLIWFQSYITWFHWVVELYCLCFVEIQWIQAHNILLNEKFQPKLAEFGLSKAFPTDGGTHISTAAAGTPGYLDPE